MPVNDRPRRFGSSKYNLSKTVRVILDLVTVSFLLTYMARPMQLFGLAGLVSGGIGFLMGLYLTILKLIHRCRYRFAPVAVPGDSADDPGRAVPGDGLAGRVANPHLF